MCPLQRDIVNTNQVLPAARRVDSDELRAALQAEAPVLALLAKLDADQARRLLLPCRFFGWQWCGRLRSLCGVHSVHHPFLQCSIAA